MKNFKFLSIVFGSLLLAPGFSKAEYDPFSDATTTDGKYQIAIFVKPNAKDVALANSIVTPFLDSSALELTPAPNDAIENFNGLKIISKAFSAKHKGLPYSVRFQEWPLLEWEFDGSKTLVNSIFLAEPDARALFKTCKSIEQFFCMVNSELP